MCKFIPVMLIVIAGILLGAAEAQETPPAPKPGPEPLDPVLRLEMERLLVKMESKDYREVDKTTEKLRKILAEAGAKQART